MTVANARRRPPSRQRRRALLTLHVALSVSWLGASIVMLTLAVAGQASQPGADADAAYRVMHLLADVLVAPLSVSVLLIGIIVGATSRWGLLRYRWVVAKLITTCTAAVLSLFALPAMTGVAEHAATRHLLAPERSAGVRLIIAGSVSVTLYLTVTAISIFKPWGRTSRGERYARSQPNGRPVDNPRPVSERSDR